MLYPGGGKLTLRDRYFGYIYSTYHQQVLQEKRGRNDIWRGLYQFPLFESDSPQTLEAVAHWVEDELSYSGGRLAPTTFSLEHRLPHQILHITIYTAELESDAVGSTKGEPERIGRLRPPHASRPLSRATALA